jgi:hypothetical protein
LTKSQIAMLTAKVYPEGRQGKKETSLLSSEVSVQLLRQARAVLKHLTKSQIAMLTAKVYPGAGQGERKDLNGTSALSADVGETLMKQARAVLKHLPALADSVAAGTASLKDAYLSRAAANAALAT